MTDFESTKENKPFIYLKNKQYNWLKTPVNLLHCPFAATHLSPENHCLGGHDGDTKATLGMQIHRH